MVSGIVGILRLDGRPVCREELERMNSILAHRGPDGSATWVDGVVGLGHRMLHTTPESLHEVLPLADHIAGLAITADARIDNREELIAALDLTGGDPGSITDSQLILAAYEKWDESCPEKLLGDFVFAIWDGRKQALFCARDHFGVKPFYYCFLSDRLFVFASEIKSLFCHAEVPRRLNEVRVGEYLASVFDDKTNTFYEDIARLPSAHSLTMGCNGMQLRTYWALDPSRELRLGSDDAYAEAFRELFIEAVRCRLRSAFPVGSTLSGGMDSSSVACVARQLLARNGGCRLRTFSAIFDDVPQCDERTFINAVVAQNGLEPHYVHGDRLSPLADVDKVLWHQDEAFYAPNLFLTWGLCGAAKEQGVRVLLDGFDGDTTVSHGEGYLNELAQAGRWFALAAEIRAYVRTFNLSYRKLLWSYARRYGLDPMISRSKVLSLSRRIWQALLRRIPHRGSRPENRPAWSAILNPTFVQAIDLAERRKALSRGRPNAPRTEREFHHRNLTWGIMPFTIEVLERTAAAFSIEPRFPFWDKRLVEFCLALPPQQKVHGGWTRIVLRRALGDILPVKIQWRKNKSNLGPNFEHGLLAYERERLEDVILKDSGTIEKYVDLNFLREAYHRFASGKAGDDALTIWKAVSLSVWLQRTGLTRGILQ
ncbi:MAG: lasso peptide isopeptide bond-forming cyclase [Candidatus Binatia bacterium]